MKLLRILTGVHAGAELRLETGVHRIAADDDADVRISDWRGTDVLLTVHEGGLVDTRRVEPVAVAEQAQGDELSSAEETGATPETAEVGTVMLIDFVPMQFGDTVLCVGNADEAWPSDLDLLSTLLIKPDQMRRDAERSRRRKLVGIALGCAMLGAVLVIGTVLMTTMTSQAALPRSAHDLAQRVDQALAAARMTELHAQARGSSVTVSGMVASPEEDTAVRKLLAQVSPTSIVRHYDIAQNDIRNIEDSLATKGVRVAYAGRGVFDVTGEVSSPSDLEARLGRVRRDFSENVREVRTHVTQSADSMTLPQAFSEVMSADDVRYAQTPDGVKHIYALPDPVPASAVVAASGALAAPAPVVAAAGLAAPAQAQAPAAAATTPAPIAGPRPAKAASPAPSRVQALASAQLADDSMPGAVIHSGAAAGIVQPVENHAHSYASPYLPLPH
ncbi:secretion protein [Paraburkholderia sediminicola]|uniref:secretion protein n=1 Tax=Paraburkholderia sediminicola TaxID=458836 RepID=UPI0038B8A04D